MINKHEFIGKTYEEAVNKAKIDLQELEENLIINKKANLKLSQRCCDFKFLEAKLNQFILNQEKSE